MPLLPVGKHLACYLVPAGCRLQLQPFSSCRAHYCLPLLTVVCRNAPRGVAFSVGHKFQLNGVMVATSEPALWGYPQQAGDLMSAVG